MDVKELRSRQWPEKAPDLLYGADLYVKEGRIVTRALRKGQGIDEPIPPGECAITSLVPVRRGLAGATSGRRAHLFVYFAAGTTDGVHDLGVIPGAAAVHNALAPMPGGLLGGVSEAVDGGAEGGLFRYRWPDERRRAGKKPKAKRPSMSDRPPRLREIEVLPAPVPGECVATLIGDARRNAAYGLSSESGTLFTVDAETGEVSRKGRVSEHGNFSRRMVLDKQGRLYGAGPLGRLWRYDPEVGEIERLDLSLPTVAGREFYNHLDSAALCPATGLIYGAGSADGVLFVFDPREMTIRSLGKVIAEPRCRCIAVGLDGRVYGIAGEPGGMGHLFCYDPAAPELRDLGMPASGSERVWHGYEFASACPGASGEIYLGEADRISQLFIYFPTIRPAATAMIEPE